MMPTHHVFNNAVSYEVTEEPEPEPEPEEPKGELPRTDGKPGILGRIAMFFVNIVQAITKYVRG